MRGALVISLDFEIHWGVPERAPGGPYGEHLRGVPESVRRTLSLFSELGVHATWATVGLLFARTRAEQLAYAPSVRPRYRNVALDPFALPVGDGELDDPLHFAPGLIAEIAATPGQEIATHTYSHFYCLEPSESRKEAFAADLESARRIMQATIGREPRSIVFPRDQRDPDLDVLLLDAGIVCYRGTTTWIWSAGPHAWYRPAARLLRLVDSYVGPDRSFPWSAVPQPNGLYDVPASFLVRPDAGELRIRRIERGLRDAARRGRLMHLWWHPHNFGVRTRENVAMLRRILDCFAECRERFGMESLSMIETANRAAELRARG